MLDGKGGQLAREGPKRGTYNFKVSISDASADGESPYLGQVGGELSRSPIEELPEDRVGWDDDTAMPPPTVSTYNHREPYVAPPPDTQTLRRELEEALEHVDKALGDAAREAMDSTSQVVEPEQPREPSSYAANMEPASPKSAPAANGWHELQGMHMLDVATLAIKAAKDYYTLHEKPTLLSAIKSERKARQELHTVLDVLKRMAIRNFAGGMRADERRTINDWIAGVRDLLAQEKDAHEQEARARRGWAWLDDATWPADSREREHAFLTTFLEPGENLPTWTPASEADALPTAFLAALADGRLLVQLHNRILKRSRKQYGEIKSWHADTGKPYRAAENLRFWIKAAEIRWEVFLKVDVLGVVYARDADVWRGFEAALVSWCCAVREELSQEWEADAVGVERPARGQA